MPADWDALALFERGATGLAEAARADGLLVDPLSGDPNSITPAPRTGLAWRCPPGFAEAQLRNGNELNLTAASPEWVVALPERVLGRALMIARADEVAHGQRSGFATPALIKLATHKLRSLPARRTSSWDEAQRWAAQADPTYRLLIADRWLDFHSEYRTFTVGREVVACSPYLIEDETYSPDLPLHRASFHIEAAAFVVQLLADLRNQDVPPGVVLDVGRLADGRFVLLEANAAWGAGLYGCDPAAVLRSVLAANEQADVRWRWAP